MSRDVIAKRVALELRDGDVVNLGIGMPTSVANHISKDIAITLQSENGILGMGPAADDSNKDPNIVNAGAGYVTVNSGAMFFDSAFSFGIIRGGHVDVTVLGALQVDAKGNIASHIIPGKMIPGMGGAMDLLTGSKRVIVAMTHTAKGDSIKILENINLPATAVGAVDLIVTELAVMEVTPDGLVLREIAPDTTVEHVQSLTGAKLIIPKDIKKMQV